MGVQMKIVSILGKGVTIDQCKFDCEIWTVNDAFVKFNLPRLDKLFFFDKHFIGSWYDKGEGVGEAVETEFTDKRGVKHKGPMVEMTVDLLDSLGCNIVSFYDFGFKNFEMYPLWKIVKDTDSEYFVNSIAYMIAYAIYLKYDQINIYGVDFVTEHEIHGGEKAGVEYWLGFALGRGIKLKISKGALILERCFFGKE
jgi:hypothetical protein